MSHMGWSNTGTALYYVKLAEVLREGSPSDLLSSDELAASASTTLNADLNRLKDFVSAFPRFLITVFVRMDYYSQLSYLARIKGRVDKRVMPFLSKLLSSIYLIC